MNMNVVAASKFFLLILKYELIFPFLSNAETYSGNATWYSLGSTACGPTYTDNDFVVAVSTKFWNNTEDPNPNHDHICNKTIRVRDAKNTSIQPITVKVVDKCGGCDESDLDLSPAAFEVFHSRDVGIFPVLWEFIDTKYANTIEDNENSRELDYYAGRPSNGNALERNTLTDSSKRR
ncbi:unnamed protein product [Orchesella dallaii]|uniref:RlpA-like protein double-psi beta-barrel domain-containing protein n=1 Tax=Orchesella dallaii TaxID=48710 RepID=A0ABP1RTP7_9HEXA